MVAEQVNLSLPFTISPLKYFQYRDMSKFFQVYVAKMFFSNIRFCTLITLCLLLLTLLGLV